MAKQGFTFIGIAENAFSYTEAAVTNPAGNDVIIVVSVTFPATEGDVASVLNLTDLITIPLLEETPKTAITARTEYTGTITWSPEDDLFEQDKVYTALISLNAKSGFTFNGVEADSFIYDGAIVVTNPEGTGNTITVTIMFPPTASKIAPGTHDIPHKVKDVTFELAYIPAGNFQRDSKAANISVITKGYWMGETEVTQGLWEAVMENNPSYHKTNPDDPAAADGWKTLPVEQVSWYDIIAFCNRLSLLDKKEPVYSIAGISDWETFDYDNDIPGVSDPAWDAVARDFSKNGYRLPAEMEWMWAAIGASEGGPDVRTKGYMKGYAGSSETGEAQNNIGQYAWYFYNAENRTHQVQQKEPNELDLYDMSGNVFEWCWDYWTADYPQGITSDYTGAASGQKRSLRGGGFSYEKGCAVASRLEAEPYQRGGDNIGLRLVCARE
jgi:formylglycine-generating enzyme required for sulfatase activity